MLGAMQPTTLQTRTADQALLALPGGQETIVDPADGRVLAGVAAAAVATDLAVRSGVAGLTGALLVAVAAAALLASGRLHTRSARLATAAAPVFGVWLAIRASPWLVPLDVLAAGGLLALGASLARGGSLADLTIPQVALRAIHAGVHAVAAPAFVAAPARAVRAQLGDDRRAELGVRIARGLLLAAPIVVLLGVLLASADAVFASFFRVDFDPVTPVQHVAALAAGAWGAAALLRVASVTPPGRLPALRPPIGAVEACIVLAGLCALFAVFTAAQLVALSEGGRHVLATAGLTYAEYAAPASSSSWPSPSSPWASCCCCAPPPGWPAPASGPSSPSSPRWPSPSPWSSWSSPCAASTSTRTPSA
jgi:hypothetical protein